MRFAKSPRFSSLKHGSPNGFALLAAMLSLFQRLHPKVACSLVQCTKQPDCILDTRRYGMANPWRKALSSFLSIVLVAGLLPCVSFYGSAWARCLNRGFGPTCRYRPSLRVNAARSCGSTCGLNAARNRRAIFNRDAAVWKYHFRGRRGSFSCYHSEWGALDLGPQLGISTRLFVGR